MLVLVGGRATAQRADSPLRPDHRPRRPLVLGARRTGGRLPRPERRRQDHHHAGRLRSRRTWTRDGPWNGAPVGQAERRRFGYMPEERGLYPGMLVGDQIEYLGRLHGLSAASAAARRRVAGTPRGRRPGGQQGGGALPRQPAARATGGRPGARPGAAGPGRAAGRPRPRRDRRHRRGAGRAGPAGCCVLFSSHQLDLVEDLCESVTIIDHGRLVVTGTVDELATSGARRLVVRVEGDRTRTWARRPAGSRRVRGHGARRAWCSTRRSTATRCSGRRWPPAGSPSSSSSAVGCPRCSGRRSRELAASPSPWSPSWLVTAARGAGRPSAEVPSRPAPGSGAVARPGSAKSAGGRAGGARAGPRRLFRVGTLLILLAVAAAIVIPALHNGAPSPADGRRRRASLRRCGQPSSAAGQSADRRPPGRRAGPGRGRGRPPLRPGRPGAHRRPDTCWSNKASATTDTSTDARLVRRSADDPRRRRGLPGGRPHPARPHRSRTPEPVPVSQPRTGHDHQLDEAPADLGRRARPRLPDAHAVQHLDPDRGHGGEVQPRRRGAARRRPPDPTAGPARSSASGWWPSPRPP